jgi:transposase
MDLARYVVDAVVVEGRGIREVARAHRVSKSWVSVLVSRYREGGYEALAPRSKRPHHSPHRIEEVLEEEIVRL